VELWCDIKHAKPVFVGIATIATMAAALRFAMKMALVVCLCYSEMTPSRVNAASARRIPAFHLTHDLEILQPRVSVSGSCC